MGDLHVNGTVFGEDRPYSSSPPSPPLPVMNPDPSFIAEEAWSAAEITTTEILRRIQPTLAADRRRRDVVHYVQRLIRFGARCEVFPYGSVPLKTYLPDGDIDLTALSCQNIEDGLVPDVHAVLRGEENNDAAEYEVKDVRFIDAEVKLVKCLVQNIVVDISFNQLGGLSTLCFLEKVDRLVAKDHLFKRSIILIKAWCYYESRILGAHHGLISTYALETLVLYIFHQFHVFLDGPLAVLYRFLDYFSKFDWDNYCVSLKGPVGKASPPDVVAEEPENGGNTLLTKEFIRSCVESFSVPPRGLDPNLRIFPQKHLNIIDPLKENNNLGRSVNRGNFYRIRSAFKYGARKLGWILMLPEDKIADELNRFFANTLDRHGSSQGNGEELFLCLSTGSKKDMLPGYQHNYEIRNGSERYVVKEVSPSAGPSFGEDSKSVETSGVLGIASTNGLSYCSNGKVENGISSETAVNSVIDDERAEHGMVSNSLKSHNDENNMASYGSAVLKDAANGLENNSFHSDRYSTSVSGGTEVPKSLLDLAGDYDSHIANLQFGQMCNGYPVSPGMVPSPPSSPGFQNRSPWETVRQCLQMNHGIHSQTNSNCVVGQFYLVNHPNLPMTSFPSEEKRKPRGTGAYFPNMTSRQFRENRPMPGRGRGQALGVHGSLQRYPRNGLALSPHELNLSAGGSFEPFLEGYPSPDAAKARSTETYFCPPSTWGSRHGHANGFPHSVEKHESGSGPGPVSPQLHGPPRTEVSSHPDPGNSSPKGSVPNLGIVAEERPNSLSVVDAKRIEVQAYHLKNEDDFPPLSI